MSWGRGAAVVVNVWCQGCLGEGVLLWWSMSGVKDVLGKGCCCGGQCLVSKMSWGRGAGVVVNVWCQICLEEGVLVWCSMSGVKAVLGQVVVVVVFFWCQQCLREEQRPVLVDRPPAKRPLCCCISVSLVEPAMELAN